MLVLGPVGDNDEPSEPLTAQHKLQRKHRETADFKLVTEVY